MNEEVSQLEKTKTLPYKMSDNVTSNNLRTDNRLLYDEKNLSNIRPFVCGLCHETFKHIVIFLVHLKEHKLDKFEDIFLHCCRPRELRNKSSEGSFDSMFKCGGCMAVFPSVCTLHDHISKVEGKLEYTIHIKTRTAVFNSFEAHTRLESLAFKSLSDHVLHGSQNFSSEIPRESSRLKCNESVGPGEILTHKRITTSGKSLEQEMLEKDCNIEMKGKNIPAGIDRHAGPSHHEHNADCRFSETSDVEIDVNQTLTAEDGIPDLPNNLGKHKSTLEDSGVESLQDSPNTDQIFYNKEIIRSCERKQDNSHTESITEVTDNDNVIESNEVQDSERNMKKDSDAECFVQNYSLVNDSNTENSSGGEVGICNDDDIVVTKKFKQETFPNSDNVVLKSKSKKFKDICSDVNSGNKMGEQQENSYNEEVRDKDRRRVQFLKCQREYRLHKQLNDRSIWNDGNDKELSQNKGRSQETDREEKGVRSSEIKVPCDVCGLIFKKRNLNRHKESHRDDKVFECELCKKTFRTKSQLKGHQLHHKTERDLICQYCGKAFNNGPNLRQHIKIHTRLRDLQCHLCPKQFSSAYVLRDHIARHSDAKPHSCQICQRSFKMSHEVLRHISTVHSKERPHQCDICSKAFKSKSNLVKHHKTHAKNM